MKMKIFSCRKKMAVYARLFVPGKKNCRELYIDPEKKASGVVAIVVVHKSISLYPIWIKIIVCCI